MRRDWRRRKHLTYEMWQGPYREKIELENRTRMEKKRDLMGKVKKRGEWQDYRLNGSTIKVIQKTQRGR